MTVGFRTPGYDRRFLPNLCITSHRIPQLRYPHILLYALRCFLAAFPMIMTRLMPECPNHEFDDLYDMNYSCLSDFTVRPPHIVMIQNSQALVSIAAHHLSYAHQNVP